MAIHPVNSLFFSSTIAGESSQTIISADTANPVTVLSVRMQQEKDMSTTNLNCGTVKIARNWAKDYTIDFPWVVCTDDVVLTKTGMDTAFVSLTYVPYNIHESGEIVLTPDGTAVINNSYSFGDMAIALLLVPILGLMIYQTILTAFRKPITWHK